MPTYPSDPNYDGPAAVAPEPTLADRVAALEAAVYDEASAAAEASLAEDPAPKKRRRGKQAE